MHIIALVKEVPDPESPMRVEVDDGGAINLEEFPPVPSPFDDNALEAALRLRDVLGGKVTVITLGPDVAVRTVERSVAAGADDGILVPCQERLNSYAAATILASAIKHIGMPDLVVCGREAADTNAGVVGPTIAEMCGIGCLTAASRIDPMGEDRVKITRATPDGHDVLECLLPAVISLDGSIYYDLRYVKMPVLFAVRKRGIPKLTLEELGISPADIAGPHRFVRVLRRYNPPEPPGCTLIDGADDATKARTLADMLVGLRAEVVG